MVSKKQYLINSEHKRRPDCQNKVMGLFYFETLRTEEIINFLIPITMGSISFDFQQRPLIFFFSDE